ncbi:hypothetical protein ACEE86_01800, partial [Proteus mirabilis]
FRCFFLAVGCPHDLPALFRWHGQLFFSARVSLILFLGLFIVSGVVRLWLSMEFAIFCSVLVGGVLGFLLAKNIARWWSKDEGFEPIILQIGLPPNELQVQYQE